MICKWIKSILKIGKEETSKVKPIFIDSSDLNNELEPTTFVNIYAQRINAPHKCEKIRLEAHIQHHAENRVHEFIAYMNNYSKEGDTIKEGFTKLAVDNFVISGEIFTHLKELNEVKNKGLGGHTGMVDDFQKIRGYGFEAPKEILGYGYPNARRVVEAWMNSPEHKDVLLSYKSKYVGVACRQLEGKNYWCVIFAR